MEQPDLMTKLRQYLDHESPHIRSRAQIILMMLEGRLSADIATELELSERTVQKWLKAWEADGLAIFPVQTETQAAGGEVVRPDDAPTTRMPKVMTPPSTPGIFATDSLAEAARKTLLFQFYQVVTNQAEIDGENTAEGVHRMRVAIRRIRSAYRLFDGVLTRDYYGKIPKRMKHTAMMLGRVRDLDVFRMKTETYIAETLSGDATKLMPLLELIDKRRVIALNDVHTWLDDERFTKFLGRFSEVIQTPTVEPPATVLPSQAYQVNHVLPRLIYTQWEAVERFDTVINQGNSATLHALRIEFKRLRYTLEFFEEVLGPTLKTVIREIKQMQDHLGDLNDADVAGDLLREFQNDLKKSDETALDNYRVTRQMEATRLKASTPTAWANYNRPEVHEALALAIAVL